MIATMLYHSFRHTRGLLRRLLIAMFVTFALVLWQKYSTLAKWHVIHCHTVYCEQKGKLVQVNSKDSETVYQKHPMHWLPDSADPHYRKTHPTLSSPDDNIGTAPMSHALALSPVPKSLGKIGDGPFLPRHSHHVYSTTEDAFNAFASRGRGVKFVEDAVSLEHLNAENARVVISQRSNPNPRSAIHDDQNLDVHTGPGSSAENDVRRESDVEGPGSPPQLPIEVLSKMTNWSEHYRFPARAECNTVQEKADALPDMIFVPFEDAVTDIELRGWEDIWISKARYIGPKLAEPKIDFVYNWVNGSQPELVTTMRPYEMASTLNDDEGVWITSHGSNRYREWDELRYSMRSVERYAGTFINRIQILVNAFEERSHNGTQVQRMGKQQPHWLEGDTRQVQVLSQEEFFGPEERKCLPSFDSLTIENQLYNTRSETDRLFALSDDMVLGKPHAASDLYSPLFGPTLGLKDNAYNTLQPPTTKDAERFGEKPFLIYTSWLLNRRFGARKRKGQVHFGHSLSRSIAREAITSFPRPALRSATQRFRGETGFQLYSWYLVFHYTMERHRETLLWSYIMLRSDTNDDGYLSWSERQKMMHEIAEGMGNGPPELFRERMYYLVGYYLGQAGLERPKVNTQVLWTSLDGPLAIKDLDCDTFDIEDCLAPGFSLPTSDIRTRSPVFSSSAIFDRVARQTPRCGDCLLKLLLNRRRAGLGPLLPHPKAKSQQRASVIKMLIKYQYTIVQPDASFFMITDAEQVEHVLIKPYIKHNKKIGQLCLNDDVVSQDDGELEALRNAMKRLLKGLLPEKSSFEK